MQNGTISLAVTTELNRMMPLRRARRHHSFRIGVISEIPSAILSTSRCADMARHLGNDVVGTDGLVGHNPESDGKPRDHMPVRVRLSKAAVAGYFGGFLPVDVFLARHGHQYHRRRAKRELRAST